MVAPISSSTNQALFIDQSSQAQAAITLPRYEWNRERTLVRFFPCEHSWSKRLHPLEYFCCTVYSRGALQFKESLDANRFIEALRTTLKNFDFLFGRLRKDGGHLLVSYCEQSDDYVQLEIGEHNSTSPLPEKIDSRILTGIVDDLEGLPMCALKLSTSGDGFTLGYHFNHAFFDQASIFYFFKYLSSCYSNRNHAVPLKKPELIDYDSLRPQNPHTFQNLNEFRLYGESEGLQFVSDKSDLVKRLSSPFPGTIVNIHFTLSAISRLKAASQIPITENDIIHALLLKIYTLDPRFEPEEEQHFSFACNMRKRCGLDESMLGNIVYSCRYRLKTEFIRRSNILELAQFNRKKLNELTPESFKQLTTWYEGFSRFSQNPKDYLPANFINPRHWSSSNWSSFHYDEISFDFQQAMKLTAPSSAPIVAALGMSIICFDACRKEKTLETSVGIPTTCLSTLKQYATMTGLFEMEH